MKVEDLQHRVDAYSPELRLLIDLSGSRKQIQGKKIRWDHLAELMASHKLTSLVFPFLEQLKQEIPEETYQTIKARNFQHTRRSLRQIEQTIHLQELFDEVNIPVIFFKGIVLSQRLYGSPTAKNSIDIDLLMPLQYVEKAANLLRERGYHMTSPAISLTPKQTRQNYGISHHYGFHNREKGVHLELHWNLTNPRSLLPLDFEGLYQRSGRIDLNGHQVNTLSDEDYLVYLAVHGARHQWCRLNWLLDFSTLLTKTDTDTRGKAKKRMESLGLVRCHQQALLMSHLVYQVPENAGEIKTDQISKYFIEKPLKALGELKSTESLDKLRDMPYHLSLRRAPNFKFNLLFRLRTHHTNWAQIQLPDRLFFLYYPLRPLLWIWDVLKKK